MSRYPEIEVAGAPREMGRQFGEAARDATRGFCEVALARIQKTVAVSRERAMRISRESAAYAAQYRPDLVEELHGIAEGAHVGFDELMLLQVRNQLTADHDGACTSFAAAFHGNRTIVAQTWDNDPALDAFTVVLTRRPLDRPASISCTQAGLISYMGFSETGMGACVNTLPAPSREIGVPHYFTLRALMETHSAEEAAAVVEQAFRAIPANIMLATPDGPADLEVTIDAVHILRPKDHGHERSATPHPQEARDHSTVCEAMGHTNHCVHADLACNNEQFPELIQSHARKRRIDHLLRQLIEDAGAADFQPVDAIKRILRDHEGQPRSICRHANDDAEHGFWETVFALIIDPTQREMHVSRGTPCEHSFETYRLSAE